MRIPLSWLRDYVDFDLDAADLAEVITNAGLEVTRIDSYGVAGADLEWPADKVVLAQLLSVEPHPDADRLVLATVDYGADERKTVVTGAPNLAPYLGRGDLASEGLFSPLLHEGGRYLDPYKDGKPTLLKGKKLRGVYNDAMLCSEVELGLGEDHDGIILLQPDDLREEWRPGTALERVFGDSVLDIDIIPNVARCASILGVAREVSALLGSELRPPSFAVVQEGEPLGERVRISTTSPELNPRFAALLVEGVEQKPAPYWMQHRLRLVGQRPIDAVVDVSNYVMFEIGQPNHSFDFDFLAERALGYSDDGQVHIVTRLATAGERLRTLDGEERELRDNNMLVTDPAGVLSLAGIIGGADSEIRPETERVLLESAAWSFINIRRTSRQHNLLTDAAFRFSRGVHPSQAILGARRAAELLRRHAGGTVARDEVDSYPLHTKPVAVHLDAAYARKLSGLDLEVSQMATLLERLGFECDTGENGLEATAPEHRLDIEGGHDLVEEICRIYGYANIPSTILADELPPQRSDAALENEERIRDLLVDAGLSEVVTYRLTTAESERRSREDLGGDDSYIRIINPSTNDRVAMRHSLLASVLEIAAANSRFLERIGLFEIGPIYPLAPGESLPAELSRLVVVLTGRRAVPHWRSDGAPLLDFWDLKGALEGLGEGLGLELAFEAGEHPSLRPGATARVSAGDSAEIGFAGEVHPLVVEDFDVRLDREQAVYAAVLDLDALLSHIPELTSVDLVPPYPAIREDLALVVDQAVPAATVEGALRRAGGKLLESVELFDVYEGEGIGDSEKSLAYHLTFQSADRTLRDRDAEKARRRILSTLEKEVGARLRG